MKDGSLLGLDQDRLEQELGPPSQGKTFVGWDQGYYLGPDQICADSKWLVVRFNAEGRTVEVGSYHD